MPGTKLGQTQRNSNAVRQTDNHPSQPRWTTLNRGALLHDELHKLLLHKLVDDHEDVLSDLALRRRVALVEGPAECMRQPGRRLRPGGA